MLSRVYPHYTFPHTSSLLGTETRHSVGYASHQMFCLQMHIAAQCSDLPEVLPGLHLLGPAAVRYERKQGQIHQESTLSEESQDRYQPNEFLSQIRQGQLFCVSWPQHEYPTHLGKVCTLLYWVSSHPVNTTHVQS